MGKNENSKAVILNYAIVKNILHSIKVMSMGFEIRQKKKQDLRGKSYMKNQGVVKNYLINIQKSNREKI